MTHIQVQYFFEKCVSYFLKYTPVTQSILCLIFLMYVRTTQHINYGRQESEKQFSGLKFQHTWYELVDPKQSYNNAKFEKPRSNSVHKKANDKVFVKSGNMSIISLEYVQKSS